MGLAFGVLLAAALADRPVPDFELRETGGAGVRLAVGTARATVVVFLGVDCPLANLYVPRLKALTGRFPPGAVRVLAVDPNGGEARAAMTAFARAHAITFPFLEDPDGRAAGLLGATRTPQAVVLDSERRVRYRGRIDDQYARGGGKRAKPSRDDLVEAVAEVVAGRPVSVPRTECSGCPIERPRRAPAPPAATYSRDIAPLLARHCTACHRPGEAGPFPLTSYAAARDRAAAIAEAVADGTMPPWHASPEFGRFRNDRRLSPEQKRLVGEWARLGCPEGEPAAHAPGPAPATGWALGVPDAVYAIPAPFAVPAEGVIEYQHSFVDPCLAADAWVRAAEVRPGNRRVVHHCNVFLHPPHVAGTDEVFETGALGSSNLIAFTPGSGPLRLPEGTAKRLPAGWRLHFVVHYTPIGTPQTDRTELALQFLPAGQVRKEVGTKLLMDPDLTIPPHAPAHRVERTWTADRDYLLLSMFPHVHLRGKSFRYAAEYPDGTAEVLLDVPAYDFNWQHRYELAEPKRLPAGTVVRCTAVYDNSADNPANPDPAATVRAGPQSWDEMFNGFFDIALADEDLPAERAAAERRRARANGALALAGCLALGCGALRVRRHGGR